MVIGVIPFCLAALAAGAEVGVLVPRDADRAVRFAAEEFAKLHEGVTGVRPPVGTEPDAAERTVRIGFPDPKANFSGETDAYSIRSTPDGLAIAGRNGRSVIYGVYDFFRRRCGCAYFWDGDVVPKSARIDFGGLDVFERSRFEYRACQYFAHRGLTRFQAEHWGFEDWKREIDWALKNRVNVMMIQFGIEDLFQLAFPETVPYPDVSVTAPTDCSESDGYDYRTPFWSYQYRHLLRRAVCAYMEERGILHPEKIGPVTHWFSRTPPEFLEARKPDFMPQIDTYYNEPSGRMWDCRRDEWFEAYEKLGEAGLEAYGYTGLLFNPGFDERTVYSNREDDVSLKIGMIDRFNREAAKRRPDAKILMEGWDFFHSWPPEEMRRLTSTLDPGHAVIWYFTADETGYNFYPWMPFHNDITEWGVTNRFPYSFGYMLALERGMDIRGNYALIREREKAVRDDPMCRAYCIWPENSHTDIFAWRFFTDNCWNLSSAPVEDLLHGFCRDRYGDEAVRMERVWRTVMPFAAKADWGGVLTKTLLEYCGTKCNDDAFWKDGKRKDRRLDYAEIPVREVFGGLADVDWDASAFVRRDAVDLARTTLDRMVVYSAENLMSTWVDCKRGTATAADVKRCGGELVARLETFGEVLDLHEDYSLTESLDRLDRIEKLRNPRAEHLLFENTACGYCRSHQAEYVRAWYLPFAKRFAALLAERAEKGDFSKLPIFENYRPELRKRAHPIRDFAPDPARRTKADFVRVMGKSAGL